MNPASYWKQVREACDKATPGPWAATDESSYKMSLHRVTYKARGLNKGAEFIIARAECTEGNDQANAEFIALSRTALPLALARIEELETALDTKAKVAAAWEGLAVERSRVMCAAEDKITAVGELLAANGCDCDCDHHHEEHNDGCFRCLACRISAALGKT